MNDLYAINAAKTEFREAFNTGAMEHLAAILDPEAVDFSDGHSSAFGGEVAESISAYYRELTEVYRVHLDPIVIEIRIAGDVAYDYGWHVWTLVPLVGGTPIIRRERYVDIWRRNTSGQWTIWMFMNNEDVAMEAPQMELPRS